MNQLPKDESTGRVYELCLLDEDKQSHAFRAITQNVPYGPDDLAKSLDIGGSSQIARKHGRKCSEGRLHKRLAAKQPHYGAISLIQRQYRLDEFLFSDTR
ncbi:hypothetical protein GCM10023166_24860 [Paeniglutamicibacter cryotolerans]